MKPFDYVQTYFWVVFIVGTCVNLVGAWHRGRHARKADPTLIRGYRRMLIGGLVFFNIPWAIMGAGIMLGGMDSVFDYLVPADGIVSGWQVAFYLTVFVEAIGLVVWIDLAGGAEVLARQPGWIFRGPENPKWFTPKIIRWSSLIPLLSCMMFLGMIWMQLPRAPAVPGETVYCITGSVWRVFLMAAGVWLVGLATLVVSIVWIRRSGLPRWWAQKSLVTPGFMLVWSIGWLALSGWGFGYQVYRACEVWSVYESGNAAQVEGVVTVIREQPKSGHAPGDKIRIGEVELVVDRFSGLYGYQDTIAYGGVLREGAAVRVWYAHGKILRVDMVSPALGEGKQ